MGRRPRLNAPDLDCHVIIRCWNDEFRLRDDDDFAHYLSVLTLMKKKHGFTLYDYVLMNSHVHLYMRQGRHSLSKTMMFLNWRTARDFNIRQERKGPVWEPRYTCIPVESERYGLALMRYIERHPLRAGLATHPSKWKWSGFGHYALGAASDLITPHPSYLDLSADSQKRQEIYEKFVITTENIHEGRDPKMSKGPVIGLDKFHSNVKKRLQRFQ